MQSLWVNGHQPCAEGFRMSHWVCVISARPVRVENSDGCWRPCTNSLANSFRRCLATMISIILEKWIPVWPISRQFGSLMQPYGQASDLPRWGIFETRFKSLEFYAREWGCRVFRQYKNLREDVLNHLAQQLVRELCALLHRWDKIGGMNQWVVCSSMKSPVAILDGGYILP